MIMVDVLVFDRRGFFIYNEGGEDSIVVGEFVGLVGR